MQSADHRRIAMILLLAIGLAGSICLGADEPAKADKAADKPEQFVDTESEEASQNDESGKPDEGAKESIEGKQSETKPADKKKGLGPQCGAGGGSMMWIMMGGVLLMVLLMGRGKRKQESKRRQMLAELKKGDKVTTIGGIVGTILDVREDEVVVKVDETNNVRMRFARWSVRGIGEQAKAEKPEDRK